MLWFDFCFSSGDSGLMLQPAFWDGLFFDLLSHFQDLCATTVIDIGGREVS